MRPWTAEHSAALLRSRLLGVNFHHIAVGNRQQVADRLRHAAELGDSLDLDQLGPDPQPDPGPKIFVAFYDGYRDTGLFGAELCHSLGIRAYFFPVFASSDPARGRLSDADLSEIATEHEIGFHSRSHRAAREITPDNVGEEVAEPVQRIRDLTGHQPRVAAWRGGTRFDDRTLGDRTLRELGLRYLVSNWSVEPIS